MFGELVGVEGENWWGRGCSGARGSVVVGSRVVGVAMATGRGAGAGAGASSRGGAGGGAGTVSMGAVRMFVVPVSISGSVSSVVGASSVAGAAVRGD